MFEYDNAAKHAAEALDRYDFTDILSECYDKGLREPYDILNEGILSRYLEDFENEKCEISVRNGAPIVDLYILSE